MSISTQSTKKEEMMTEDKKVYKSKDIMELLDISKNKANAIIKKAYENNGPFRVIKVGTEYRIPVKSFDEWLENGPSL